MGTIQTRFYFEEEMGVLSCQSIFTESFNAERFREMCVMANLFNEQLGFGMVLIMGEEELVFEINNLIEEDTTISDALLEKLVNIPSEAMKEHLPAFLDVANKNALPQDVFDKFWND